MCSSNAGSFSVLTNEIYILKKKIYFHYFYDFRSLRYANMGIDLDINTNDPKTSTRSFSTCKNNHGAVT